MYRAGHGWDSFKCLTWNCITDEHALKYRSKVMGISIKSVTHVTDRATASGLVRKWHTVHLFLSNLYLNEFQYRALLFNLFKNTTSVYFSYYLLFINYM